MALGLGIEIAHTGVVADYWRIGKVVADFPHDSTSATVLVTVEGWFNAEARQSGKGPVPGSSRIYVLSLTSTDEAEGLSKPALYAAIAGLPEFTGAVPI
jgi:hypothetical protein